MKTLSLKRSAIATAIGLASTIFAGSAGAYTWSLGGTNNGALGIYSSVLGATHVTFDNPYPAGVTYTGGAVVQGNIGTAAPPAGDTSKYFTVGPTAGSPGTFKYTSLLNYFGFNFSSPDSYNFIDFKRGNTLIQTYSGTDLANELNFSANGNQGASHYLNVTADNASELFDTVVFRSTSNAFETDNHAFVAVPEPETYAMMLAGLGLMGFMARRRKQRSTL